MAAEAAVVGMEACRPNHTWLHNNELKQAISGCGVKMLSRKSENEPHRTHLRRTWCWEQLRSHSKKKITITHNYSLNTVGKGALYLPVLAQHSTVPVIATLLLVHRAFYASCHILLRHAKAYLLYTLLLWTLNGFVTEKLSKLLPTAVVYWLSICPICRVCPPAAF